MLSEVKQLLELQSIDSGRDDAAAHARQLCAQKAHIERKIEQARAEVEELRERFRQIGHDSLMKNLEVDEVDRQIRVYQERLDKSIISFKEMEDLRVKIVSERVRISTLEDDALAAMDAIEAAKIELQEAEACLATRESDFKEQLERMAAELEETQRRQAALESDRSELASAMFPFLVSQYESLHAEYSDAIAEIRNGTCGGCKLRVSGNTTERARGAMGIVTCEHCSRILHSS